MLATAMEFAMAGRQLAPLRLSDEERSELESWSSRRKTAQALALRARIVLARAEGAQNKDVAARLSLDSATVGKWRRRFAQHRVDGLRDEPRSGAPRTIGDARVEAVIVTTLESVPKERYALEFARHGESERLIGLERAAHLARLRLAAAPGGDVQALDRPGLRGQGARRGGSLCLAARACRRVVRGRKIPDPGARPQPAVVAVRPGQLARRSHDGKPEQKIVQVLRSLEPNESLGFQSTVSIPQFVELALLLDHIPSRIIAAYTCERVAKS
jgi:hypothetical protein